MTEQLLQETFSDLIQKWGFEVKLKSKRRFDIYSLEKVPFSVKAQVKEKADYLATTIGRRSAIIDNPIIKDDTINSGIWYIRIL